MRECLQSIIHRNMAPDFIFRVRLLARHAQDGLIRHLSLDEKRKRDDHEND